VPLFSSTVGIGQRVVGVNVKTDGQLTNSSVEELVEEKHEEHATALAGLSTGEESQDVLMEGVHFRLDCVGIPVSGCVCRSFLPAVD
jgi:putative N-acetylmannosamine-6-phosphate epimerase